MKRLLEDLDDSGKIPNTKGLCSNLYNDSGLLGKMFFSFAKPILNHLLTNEQFDDTQLLSISGNSYEGTTANSSET